MWPIVLRSAKRKRVPLAAGTPVNRPSAGVGIGASGDRVPVAVARGRSALRSRVSSDLAVVHVEEQQDEHLADQEHAEQAAAVERG
ncbi:MAG: hypothetical protein ABI611_19360 [Solirubrobacteraceae bacterium]